jgi:hypothetical protein
VAREKGIETISEFFGSGFAKKVLAARNRRADLIIGNNVLAHVPDINDFVEGLKIALKPGGVITMEFPHLLRLIEECQFDTIYHEHYSYLSLLVVRNIFNSRGLEVFDVEELPTHGGSLRIYARHLENERLPVQPSVGKLIRREVFAGLENTADYIGFQERIDQIKFELLSFLIEQRNAGKKVMAYGAAGKGNTLLNYCGIKGTDLIQCVADASPYKQGKYLPGSHIPVVAPAAIAEIRPDFILVLPWNLKDEIRRQLHYVNDWGCSFVIPIPYLTVESAVAVPL